jgi:hypothetical protein
LRYQPGFGWMNDALHRFAEACANTKMKANLPVPLLFLCHGHSLIFLTNLPRLALRTCVGRSVGVVFLTPNAAILTGHGLKMDCGFGGTRILGFRAVFCAPFN